MRRAFIVVLSLLLGGPLLLVGCGTEEPMTDQMGTTGVDTTSPSEATDGDGPTEPTLTTVAGPDTAADESRSELPQPVQARQRELLNLAEAKDYAGLAETAAQTDQFNYSFGEPAGSDPEEYWRGLEQTGESPAEELARILRLPYAEQDGTFVWPFAHTLETPFDQGERARLEEYFTDERIEEWERFGGYFGYRTAISSEGEWLYFVTGD